VETRVNYTCERREESPLLPSHLALSPLGAVLQKDSTYCLVTACATGERADFRVLQQAKISSAAASGKRTATATLLFTGSCSKTCRTSVIWQR